jgi:hypothetical protein
MKIAAIAVSIVLFLIILLAAFQTVFVRRKQRIFLRRLNDKTGGAYTVLAITAAALFVLSVFDVKFESVEIAGFKATVRTLEKKVDSISEQMKVFYSRKIIEQYGKNNWNEVRTVRRGDDPRFILEVTLKQKPIPNSIEVWEGRMEMGEEDYVLNGQKLQFPANTNTPKLGITIKYYPDVGKTD